jgi:hypothetical protein
LAGVASFCSARTFLLSLLLLLLPPRITEPAFGPVPFLGGAVASSLQYGTWILNESMMVEAKFCSSTSVRTRTMVSKNW